MLKVVCRRHYWSKFLICSVLLSLVGLLAFLSTNMAYGAPKDESWVSGDITLLSNIPTNSSANPNFQNCPIYALTDNAKAACKVIKKIDPTTQTPQFRMTTNVSSNDNHSTTEVSFGFDREYHQIRGICTHIYDCLYDPSHDILLSKEHTGSGIYKSLVIYENFSENLIKENNFLMGKFLYRLKDGVSGKTFQNSKGYTWSIKGIAMSENGDWAALETSDRGIVILDTKTMTYRRITKNSHPSNMNGAHFAISNDGKYLVVTGERLAIELFDISDCGDPATDDRMYSDAPISRPCPVRQIDGKQYIKNFIFGSAPVFSPDGNELSFSVQSRSADDPARRVTLGAPGYKPIRLEYLALGDSFSSGEGDIETHPDTGQKYYRPYTDNHGDQPGELKEKCHISSRSYPYLLARSMDLAKDSPKQWDTVACSGARIGDVAGASGVYGGQWQDNQPRLQGLENVEELKRQAMNDFIPGRQQQIEFVRRYKPKVVTITIGGNDVGFGDKIFACVTSPGTCLYAKKEYRNKLKEELYSKLDDISSLFREISNASSASKVFAIGYPQFIESGREVQCQGTLFINNDEREMIVNAQEYFNNIIEAAADEANIYFIDIEHALGDNKLCDSSATHVSPIVDIMDIGGYRQESFHPNNRGHEAMATQIWGELGSRLLETSAAGGCSPQELGCLHTKRHDTIPELPEYFLENNMTNKGIIRKGDFVDYSMRTEAPYNVHIPSGVFEPLSEVTVTIHSDPLDLVTINTDISGALDSSIMIPESVDIGWHTLVLSGTTVSGDELELYQAVAVFNDDPSNPDEINNKSYSHADRAANDGRTDMKQGGRGMTMRDNNKLSYDEVDSGSLTDASNIGTQGASVQSAVADNDGILEEDVYREVVKYPYVLMITIIVIITLSAVLGVKIYKNHSKRSG